MPGIRIGASPRLLKKLLPNAPNTWWVVVSPLGLAQRAGEQLCLATQCMIEPSLRPESPKNGNIRGVSQRLSRIRPACREIESTETGPRIAKARCWRAFLLLSGAFSRSPGLAGWRRSADRTRLQTNSLLSGNLTGNFAEFWAPRDDSGARTRCAAAIYRAIPYVYYQGNCFEDHGISLR